MTKEQLQEAELRAIPKPPVKNELGGGIYYTCYWISCGQTLKKWWDYCPYCGQKILWEGEDYE